MSTQENLEGAEHAQHASHSPFDRRVAVTMAIVAAVLAGVAMVGHRKHNETLIFKTEAAELKVEESNQWAFFQAKKQRQHLDKTTLTQIQLMPVVADKVAERDKMIPKLQEVIARYDEETLKIKADAEDKQVRAKEAVGNAHHSHDQADKLDVAHLAVELGLVLCSIALLTKKKLFWFIGVVSSMVGVFFVAWAMSLPNHTEHHDVHPTEESKPKGAH